MADEDFGNRPDPSSVYEHLLNMDREPFREILARTLGRQPSDDSLEDLAERYPEKWANYVSTIAKLSGYHDKLEVDANLAVQVQHMSDAELQQRITEHAEALGITFDNETSLPDLSTGVEAQQESEDDSEDQSQ